MFRVGQRVVLRRPVNEYVEHMVGKIYTVSSLLGTESIIISNSIGPIGAYTASQFDLWQDTTHPRPQISEVVVRHGKIM